MSTDVIGRPRSGFDASSILGQYFYFVMALLIALAVPLGFSFTVNDNLFHPIHPAIPRPAILYVHGSLFVAWVALFVVQTGLVRSRNVQLHRRVGAWGVALGIAMIVVGI